MNRYSWANYETLRAGWAEQAAVRGADVIRGDDLAA